MTSLNENQTLTEPINQYIGSHTLFGYIQSLENTYFDYDIFDILRKIQSFGVFDIHSSEKNPKDNLYQIYINQDVSLKFDTNAIDKIKVKNNKLYISINGIGLLSINSPLPKHLIEYIFERTYLYGDKSWFDFINFLQSRSLFLFYKSWEFSQIFNSLDHSRSGYFNQFIASLIGLNTTSNAKYRKYVDFYDKLYFSGFYLSKAKSAKNISKILSMYFSVPVLIEENFGTWHTVDKESRTSIGKSNFTLADGLLIGDKIFDKQSKFRIVLGPIDFETYKLFLKNNLNYHKLKDWMDFLAFSDFDWDCQLILLKEQVPSLFLNTTNQLGLTTWLGYPKQSVNDMIVVN